MNSRKIQKISVIVPVNRGRETFHLCLNSLADAVPWPHEVIIVGDGVGETYDALLANYNFTYMKLPACQGAARARNEGARRARGDVLFFVDSDVVVPQDVIQQISDVFRKNPKLDVFIGSYDDMPLETNFLSQYKNLFHHYVHQNSSENASTFWGACGVVKRSVFLQLDGFDASYQQATIEDIEFGYRLRDENFQIKLVKSLQVKHLKRWEALPLLRSEFFDRALPWTRLIWREKKLIDDLNLAFTSRFSTILVYVLVFGLIAMALFPELWLFVLSLITVLLWLNHDLYLYFWRKRGGLFTLKAIPWHWFYYFYSGIAFITGTVHFLGQKPRFLQFMNRSIAID